MTAFRRYVAVLDPHPEVLSYVAKVLGGRFDVRLFSTPEEFLGSLERETPDLLLMDWFASGTESEEDALRLLTQLRSSRPILPIVVLACPADPREMLAITRFSGVDILLKPFRRVDIDGVVDQILGEGAGSAGEEHVKEIPLNENTSFVRSTKRMREIESQCKLVARADIPVLILGESGTGKEVAAMLVHSLSTRSQRNFLKVNCAAMPADLLESELFGYEQGAFTGAVKSKPGKFELCDGGTIFLDEIGEMPAVLQAKLLQVLQDGTFSRLGSRSTVKVNVRVVAATNIDVKEAISQKRFREDLYYRLNGFTLRMPPLRERVQEIPILAAHFMRKAAARYECEPLPISPALLQALSQHTWPGNLRELDNTIKRYLVLREEREIINELSAANMNAMAAADAAGAQPANLKAMVRNLKGSAEAVAIAQSLEGTGWNRKAAASDLKISYKALLYKIKQYNLNPPARSSSYERIGVQ